MNKYQVTTTPFSSSSMGGCAPDDPATRPGKQTIEAESIKLDERGNLQFIKDSEIISIFHSGYWLGCEILKE